MPLATAVTAHLASPDVGVCSDHAHRRRAQLGNGHSGATRAPSRRSRGSRRTLLERNVRCSPSEGKDQKDRVLPIARARIRRRIAENRTLANRRFTT